MSDTWLQDDERHPQIYNEFDLERARKAGTAYGERLEQGRIIGILLDKINDLRDASLVEPSEQERTLSWVIKLIRGDDEQES